MIQAANTSLTAHTACIISVGTRKMPLPMTIPTTIAAAWLVVRRRASSGRDTTEGKTVVDVVICVDKMRVRVVLEKCAGNISRGQELIERPQAGDMASGSTDQYWLNTSPRFKQSVDNPAIT